MRARSRLALSGALVFTLGACERVVAVDVPQGTTRLVVEARLERVQGNASGTQRIRLTTTAPYFDQEAPPPARGALVRVTDDAGVTVPFVESSPGTYTTTGLTLGIGRAYTLRIDWQGDRYESTDVARPVPPVDSLYFTPRRAGGIGPKEGLRAAIDLQDPRGQRDYYLWDQFVDGVRLSRPDTTGWYRVTATDEGFDGVKVEGFQPYDGIVIKPGSEVLMRQVPLSREMYRYFFALSDQASNDGSPFAVPAASLRGNVANRTDPSRFALGYFIAAEVAEARARLEGGR